MKVMLSSILVLHCWIFPTYGQVSEQVVLTKKFASRPRTLSTDKTRGVNEAQRRAAASEYFFFSSSAEERTAVTINSL